MARSEAKVSEGEEDKDKTWCVSLHPAGSS